MTRINLSKLVRPIKSIRQYFHHQRQYIGSLERELISLRLSHQNQR